MQNYFFRTFSSSRLTKLDAARTNEQIRKWRVHAAEERLKRINGGYRGSAEEFRNTVLRYWEKYGIKPERVFFSLYCDGQDAYDPRYITDPIWITHILPYFNDLTMRRAYDDKGMYHRLFPGVKHPDTVVKRMGGYYYDGDGEQIVTREEARALCLREKHLIFKPALDSAKGKGIAFFDAEQDGADGLDRILENAGMSFVAQRFVRQHPDLARIHRDSLNTIRVVSFHFGDEVHILSTILRMGANGSRVDNISAGGMSCPIRPDGHLADKAVNRKSEWTEEHPSGIRFQDIRVPSFDRVIETTKRLHCLLPHMNLIGWDFAVDEAGEPVLIEFNNRPEQNQISCGPTFGDLTDEVLDEVFLKQTLKKIRT